MIVVHHWGIAGSVRDAGLPGRAVWGAPRGGAVDAWSLALANRLVGNPESASGFESSGGLDVEVIEEAALVSITGARADISVRDGPPVGWGTAVALVPGARLRIGRLHDGARVYVAVRGGLGTVGSGGDVVRVGPDPGTDVATVAAVPVPPPDRLKIWPGPRLDWFERSAWQRLCAAEFRVSAMSDRVGVRLRGPRFARIVATELPSEGVVEGAIQVPPDGDPIVMLADHPTTGGYPVIAVVDRAHLRHVAQLVAGATVRFSAPFPPPDHSV